MVNWCLAESSCTMKLIVKTFPLTIFCVALIWYLCLFRPPHIRTLEGIPNFDKVVHCSMYLGTCSIFWLESFFHHLTWNKLKLALVAVMFPILMSGIIELAQEYFTTYRSGDWADFLANSVGVLLSLFSMLALKHYFYKTK